MIFQDLVRKMLVVDPKKRLSVYDALRHPWIVAETNSTRELPVVTEKLKEFNHKRRLKVHPFVFRLIFLLKMKCSLVCCISCIMSEMALKWNAINFVKSVAHMHITAVSISDFLAQRLTIFRPYLYYGRKIIHSKR